MRIEKKNLKNIVSFENVPKGTVFKDENETIYMRLDSFYRTGSVGYDAVVLENGSLVFFGNRDEKVEVLKDAVLTY